MIAPTPTRARQANSFGSAARSYEEIRPGYPAEAVDWLVPSDARRVLDIGAGTGKFTRLLRADDREVIAVDPSAQMLEVLREKVAGVETLIGTAEQLPLPDESVDAVTVAQAWHWVDGDRGVREIARVLKPGGVLGLIWNARDDGIPWVREFGEAIGANDAITPETIDELAIGAPFEPGEGLELPWSQHLTRPGLLALARTRSHFLVQDQERQDLALAAVAEVVTRHHGDAAAIDLPYVTRAYRFRRR